MPTASVLCQAKRSAEHDAQNIVDAQVVETQDLTETSEIDWYHPLDPDVWRLEMLQTTRAGRTCSRWLAWALEKVRLAPKGTASVSNFLEKGADGLVKGGKMGVFTPMYLCVARKPQSVAASSALTG